MSVTIHLDHTYTSSTLDETETCRGHQVYEVFFTEVSSAANYSFETEVVEGTILIQRNVNMGLKFNWIGNLETPGEILSIQRQRRNSIPL